MHHVLEILGEDVLREATEFDSKIRLIKSHEKDQQKKKKLGKFKNGHEVNEGRLNPPNYVVGKHWRYHCMQIDGRYTNVQ